MWFPNDKMDVNKFVDVQIPSKSSYLQRFGFVTCPATMYTGDEFAPIPRDKVATIADMESYDKMMQEYELEKAKDES